jgi:hypothetical protein
MMTGDISDLWESLSKMFCQFLHELKSPAPPDRLLRHARMPRKELPAMRLKDLILFPEETRRGHDLLANLPCPLKDLDHLFFPVRIPEQMMIDYHRG